MKVRELIAELQKQDPEKDVLIYVGSTFRGWHKPYKVEASNGHPYFANGKWHREEVVGIGFDEEYAGRFNKQKS